MNLVNFTYQMQFTVIFLNNNNENSTTRMDIDLRRNQFVKSDCIIGKNDSHVFKNNRNLFGRRRKITNDIKTLNFLYKNILKTFKNRPEQSNNTYGNFSLKYKRHYLLNQRLKLKHQISEEKQKIKIVELGVIKSNLANIIQRRKNRTEADVDKLFVTVQKKKISSNSRLDDDGDIDFDNMEVLMGNRRDRRALSDLIRDVDESEVDMAGLPNTLAPRYHSLKRKRVAVTEYGIRYANITNRTSDEELHFLNYTELQEECAAEREKIMMEAKELNDFYLLQEEEEAEELMKAASYQVDISQLELKCELFNNCSNLEYRIHNPELYPHEDVHDNLARLKVAEERVVSLEKKQIAERIKRREDYDRLSSLGRTTLKPNHTTQSQYLRSRYLFNQERIFGTLYKRFSRPRREKERAYARLKIKPKTTHFRDYWGCDYVENWYQKGKTFGDFGQDSNADFHLLRQSPFRSALYSNFRDGPYNYVN
uniref:Uncharacterized protein n=1 Tax=Cacopsylla melanoneura TaxID=428564 RepID=A0A8D8R9M2_9HEMI